MPAAGGKFWGILEAFLYQKYVPECILGAFLTQKRPEILKISACGGQNPVPGGYQNLHGYQNFGIFSKVTGGGDADQIRDLDHPKWRSSRIPSPPAPLELKNCTELDLS